jgi:hypothetical protein
MRHHMRYMFGLLQRLIQQPFPGPPLVQHIYIYTNIYIYIYSNVRRARDPLIHDYNVWWAALLKTTTTHSQEPGVPCSATPSHSQPVPATLRLAPAGGISISYYIILCYVILYRTIYVALAHLRAKVVLQRAALHTLSGCSCTQSIRS